MGNPSHRFSEIEQASSSLIGNSELETELKLKLDLEPLFEKLILATFFRFLKA